MALFPSRGQEGGTLASGRLLRRVAPGFLKADVKPFTNARTGGYGQYATKGGFNRPRMRARQPSTFAADLQEAFGPNSARQVRVKGTPAFVKRYLLNVFEQRLQSLESEREAAPEGSGERMRKRAHIDALIDKYEGIMADEMRQGADQAFETGFRGFLMGNYHDDDLARLADLSATSAAARNIVRRRVRWTHTPGVYAWLAASVANRQAFDDYLMLLHDFGPVHPLYQEGYGQDLWALYLYYKYWVSGAAYDDGYDNEDLAFHSLWADTLPAEERRPEIEHGRYTRDTHVFPRGRGPGEGPAGYNPEATRDAEYDNLPATKRGTPGVPPARDPRATVEVPEPRPPARDDRGEPTDPTLGDGTTPGPTDEDRARMEQWAEDAVEHRKARRGHRKRPVYREPGSGNGPGRG